MLSKKQRAQLKGSMESVAEGRLWGSVLATIDDAPPAQSVQNPAKPHLGPEQHLQACIDSWTALSQVENPTGKDSAAPFQELRQLVKLSGSDDFALDLTVLAGVVGANIGMLSKKQRAQLKGSMESVAEGRLWGSVLATIESVGDVSTTEAQHPLQQSVNEIVAQAPQNLAYLRMFVGLSQTEQSMLVARAAGGKRQRADIEPSTQSKKGGIDEQAPGASKKAKLSVEASTNLQSAQEVVKELQRNPAADHATKNRLFESLQTLIKKIRDSAWAPEGVGCRQVLACVRGSMPHLTKSQMKSLHRCMSDADPPPQKWHQVVAELNKGVAASEKSQTPARQNPARQNPARRNPVRQSWHGNAEQQMQLGLQGLQAPAMGYMPQQVPMNFGLLQQGMIGQVPTSFGENASTQGLLTMPSNFNPYTLNYQPSMR